MDTQRLEAFTDGVIAVVITIGLYVAMAMIWFIPDRRIESAL
jgi:hypothetical protein